MSIELMGRQVKIRDNPQDPRYPRFILCKFCG